VRTADNKHYLINSGTGSYARWSIIPFLRSRGIQRLDGLVARGTHKRVHGGMRDICSTMPVSTVYCDNREFAQYCVGNTRSEVAGLRMLSVEKENTRGFAGERTPFGFSFQLQEETVHVISCHPETLLAALKEGSIDAADFGIMSAKAYALIHERFLTSERLWNTIIVVGNLAHMFMSKPMERVYDTHRYGSIRVVYNNSGQMPDVQFFLE
jgi:hypothetical protein